MVFTGKTKNLGVIGYPIKHSLSPVIQNTAIQEAGIDYAYIAMPIAPEDLEKAVIGLKALNFTGFNVTIPHKVNIMQYLDEIDEMANLIGAVNTVHIKDGKLYGYNTDAIGFINPLVKEDVEIKDKTAVILGAGGACRAVVCGLIKQEIKNIILAVRNPAKAQLLANDFKDLVDIKVCDWHSEEIKQYLAQADLLVNTTPLGMEGNIDSKPPVDWESVKKSAFVYDIVYIPAETKFLQEAKEYGHKILNGERMLAEQGAATLHLWTDKDINVDIMVKTLHDYLNKNK